MQKMTFVDMGALGSQSVEVGYDMSQDGRATVTSVYWGLTEDILPLFEPEALQALESELSLPEVAA